MWYIIAILWYVIGLILFFSVCENLGGTTRMDLIVGLFFGLLGPFAILQWMEYGPLEGWFKKPLFKDKK